MRFWGDLKFGVVTSKIINRQKFLSFHVRRSLNSSGLRFLLRCDPPQLFILRACKISLSLIISQLLGSCLLFGSFLTEVTATGLFVVHCRHEYFFISRQAPKFMRCMLLPLRQERIRSMNRPFSANKVIGITGVSKEAAHFNSLMIILSSNLF
jgi:hypothetical protein